MMLRIIPYGLPLLAASGDALAWGLYTHVYYAQQLLWLLPFTDPRLLRACRRLPALVLAGACLPDLSLMARPAHTPSLGDSHQWRMLRGLVAHADGDEAVALTVGYASHLLTDILAHNHFVPAHEHHWFSAGIVTHACVEWAMDAHVADRLHALPADLLGDHSRTAAAVLAHGFGCSERGALRAIRYLARGERGLRASRVPAAVRWCATAIDPRTQRRFHRYLLRTSARLHVVERLLAGEEPRLAAEVCPAEARHHLWLRSGDRPPRLAPIPSQLFDAP
ncbi:MAG: zinc dependent phospholipase C family protein [Rhodocyclaceae bacterium]|nr:zinc dependent phospholipase C family protein [Rhodocyclaceae bacterium]